MQQGQTYILIARFPNPNYGVKMVNFIITPLTYRELSVSSSLRHLEVSLSRLCLSVQRKSLKQTMKWMIEGFSPLNLRGGF